MASAPPPHARPIKARARSIPFLHPRQARPHFEEDRGSSGAPHVFDYTYDQAGRLREVRRDGVLAATYDYDANGNRLSFTGPGGTTAAGHDARTDWPSTAASMITGFRPSVASSSVRPPP